VIRARIREDLPTLRESTKIRTSDWRSSWQPDQGRPNEIGSAEARFGLMLAKGRSTAPGRPTPHPGTRSRGIPSLRMTGAPVSAASRAVIAATRSATG
jgi:hypothetical protein